MSKIIWLAIFAGLMTGCITPQPVVKLPLYQYRADIQIGVDGALFDGMGVTIVGEKSINIASKAPLNVLKIGSCAREFVTQDVDKDWFGGVGHTYNYSYKPNKYESDGACPLYVQAIGANGVAAWGYLFFRTDEKLRAEMDCNGTHWKWAGASVCQTKTGLRQEIFFSSPVKFEGSELCEISPDPKNPNAFIVATSKDGFCYATFTDGKDFHSMVLLGYDQVLVRSGQ